MPDGSVRDSPFPELAWLHSSSLLSPGLGHASRTRKCTRPRGTQRGAGRLSHPRPPSLLVQSSLNCRPGWVKELGRAGEAIAPCPHPCFPGSGLRTRAPPSPAYLASSLRADGNPQRRASYSPEPSACVCTYVSSLGGPNSLRSHPPSTVGAMNPLKTGSWPAEDRKLRVASRGSPPLGPRFPACVGPGGQGRIGPGHNERHSGPQHLNTRKNQWKNKVIGQGPEKMQHFSGTLLETSRVAPESL